MLDFSLFHHYQGSEPISIPIVFIFIYILHTRIFAYCSIVKLVLILLFIYVHLCCTQGGQRDVSSVDTVPDPRGRTVRQEVEITVVRGLGQSSSTSCVLSPALRECCCSVAPSAPLGARMTTSVWWGTCASHRVVSQVYAMFRSQ